MILTKKFSSITNEKNFICQRCGKIFPVRDGVVRTLDTNNKFYEGAYNNQVKFLPVNENPWNIWPLWLINSGYEWTVRRVVPAGSNVLELGCAAGVRYFGSRYKMVACDLSETALLKLDFYCTRIQADASKCIPLPSGSVDAVVSSFFWEHINPLDKPKILAECHRILKP